MEWGHDWGALYELKGVLDQIIVHPHTLRGSLISNDMKTPLNVWERKHPGSPLGNRCKKAIGNGRERKTSSVRS